VDIYLLLNISWKISYPLIYSKMCLEQLLYTLHVYNEWIDEWMGGWMGGWMDGWRMDDG
jgi:hypothetical protein